MRRLLMLALVVCLTGCATSYGEMGITGGLAAKQIEKGVYEVEFAGNGYTSHALAISMVMLKAAELTVANGYTRFVLLPTDAESEAARKAGKLRAMAASGNRGAEGLVSLKQDVSYAVAGGMAMQIRYTTGTVIVVMFGKGDGQKGINAAETVAKLRPIVVPESAQTPSANNEPAKAGARRSTSTVAADAR